MAIFAQLPPYPVGRGTIANALREHGVDPALERGRRFTVEVLTLRDNSPQAGASFLKVMKEYLEEPPGSLVDHNRSTQ